jgi:hypothetical protein
VAIAWVRALETSNREWVMATALTLEVLLMPAAVSAESGIDVSQRRARICDAEPKSPNGLNISDLVERKIDKALRERTVTVNFNNTPLYEVIRDLKR